MLFNDCLLFNARKLEKQLNQLALMQFKSLNIHPTYGYIMLVVEEYGDVRTKDIVNVLGLSSSTVTRMVDKLVKDEYLVRKSTKMELTKKGQVMIPEIKAAFENFHNCYIEQISQDKIDETILAIQNFLKELEKIEKN